MNSEEYLKKLTEGPLIDRLKFMRRELMTGPSGQSVNVQRATDAKAENLSQAIRFLEEFKEAEIAGHRKLKAVWKMVDENQFDIDEDVRQSIIDQLLSLHFDS